MASAGGHRESPSADGTGFAIRLAKADDVPVLADIEQRCFAIPWSAEALASELSDPVRTRALVAEDANGRILGYVSSWFIFDEGEIHNIAVHPDAQGHGIATALLDTLLALGRREGIASFTLEVRPSNAAARALYARMGFSECGRRRNYYPDTGEDAIIMFKKVHDRYD